MKNSKFNNYFIMHIDKRMVSTSQKASMIDEGAIRR